MIRTLCTTALLAGLVACSPAPETEGLARVEITQAVCRPTPNGRDITGCYLTLTSSRDDRLISVASPAAATAQVHEMKTEDGIMKMAELKAGLALPAGEAVTLKPGGNHIMLMGVTQPLKAGDTVSLTLTFDHAAAYGVRAIVGQPAAAPTGHGGH
ncbi:copper chaperone PCu(A)C [Rhizobium sp. CRIBSB]|nr:copper chaperone PCu(A)C [Rhizobium sp. CRIBSB]